MRALLHIWLNASLQSALKASVDLPYCDIPRHRILLIISPR